MQHGAAFGSGVYLAPCIGTSLRYSKKSGQNLWGRTQLGNKLYGIALCEIVNHVDLKPPNPHYVIKNDEWIITRFFFLFTSSDNFKDAYNKKIQANSLKISPKLR